MRASQQITAYFQRFVGIANLASQMDEIIRFSGRQPNLAGTEDRNKLLTTLKKIQSADDTIAFTWLYNINSKDFLQSDGTYKNSTTFDATSRIWYNPVINSEKTIVTGRCFLSFLQKRYELSKPNVSGSPDSLNAAKSGRCVRFEKEGGKSS